MTVRGDNASRQRLRYRPDSDLTVELSWYGLTDVGLRRDKNQDSFVVAPPLFAVADGMGGHAAGEVASAAVVRRLAELGGSDAVTVEDLTERLLDAVDDIELEAGEAGLGAGTTVTGVVFDSAAESPSWTVFNIGDSRVYQYFKGALAQVTVDHSVVQHLIDTGAITPEEAEVHPHANVITRAVGFNEDPIPDTVSLALIPGQRLLICSDGLTKELTDLGVQHFLSQAATAEEAAKSLISQALGNAGRDNVTAIVIDVHAVGDARDTADLSAVPAAEALIAEPVASAAVTGAAAADAAPDAGATLAASAAGSAGAEQSGPAEQPGQSGAGLAAVAAGSAGAVDPDPAQPLAYPDAGVDADEVFVGTERQEHRMRGSEVAASRHIGSEARDEVLSEGTGAAE